MPSLRSFGRVVLVAALALPAAAVFVPSDASASVSIAVSFDALVKDADSVAVITPSDSQSVWEDGRIFTYTKVHVDQGVAGDLAAGNDTYVRTMGGTVGKIGQMVDGEPVLTKDKPALLFLRKLKAGSFDVSARGQGQYPITVDEKTKVRRVIRSSTAGMLLPPKPAVVAASGVQVQSGVQPQAARVDSAVLVKLAHEVLHERKLDEVTREIATNWKRLHPAPVNQTK